MAQITYKCPKCLSSEVTTDSTALWSDDKQEWVFSDVQGAITCQSCGYEHHDHERFCFPLSQFKV